MTDAAWLSCYALTVVFQRDLSENARSKNTVILEFQNPRTEERQAVGGVDLHDAISKANLRINSSSVPVPIFPHELLEKFRAVVDTAENLN